MSHESPGSGRVDVGDGQSAVGSSRSSIDWQAAEHSQEFRELVRKRRGFVLPATIFFLAWYFGFIILASTAPDFMGESVYEGLTVGYTLALTQFIMVWGLSWLYLRRADRVFDPLAKRAADRALEQRGTGAARPAADQPAPGNPPSPSGPEVRPS